MHFGKMGREVPEWIDFFQRSSRGKGRPTGPIPVTVTNVRYSSRPFQPGRLSSLVSAPGDAISWNVPYHSHFALQTMSCECFICFKGLCSKARHSWPYLQWISSSQEALDCHKLGWIWIIKVHLSTPSFAGTESGNAGRISPPQDFFDQASSLSILAQERCFGSFIVFVAIDWTVSSVSAALRTQQCPLPRPHLPDQMQEA